ncbi:1-acyl-sn-glycerol-3-phosphate acyltransferase [Pedococcus cremeus]|uniref:1-acyl-sn-glycerol-3-phosphate acyltransferase n=1 Tax=Pedococcus cremeus TaxID=587636 RepID=A0A1H9XUE3_9MICO|nr:1-acyl-sn-glycerol-3-phosphate acyltransferase [Pedococcus cremeus]SES49313.1 1-acyl-sn-glycerol-3-phosphate acyltransferase [Pedococcus cremeus]
MASTGGAGGKRPARKSAGKSTAKSPAKSTAKSTAQSSAKSTAKSPAKSTVKATSRKAGGGALAAGAARASGERAKRRSTPLIAAAPERPALGVVSSISDTEPRETVAAEASATEATVGETTTANAPSGSAPQRKPHRPHPVAKAVPTKKAVAKSGTRTTRPKRRAASRSTEARPVVVEPATRGKLVAVPDESVRVETPTPRSQHVAVAPGIEELLKAGVAAMRVAAEAMGLAPEEVEQRVAETLSFVRRRLTGDYMVDEFGFDEDFTEHAYLPLLRPLYRRWFRVEVRGIENIPTQGGALVVANHSGTIAMDSLMTQVAVHDEHSTHRHLRMLGADLVFQTPVIGQVARRSGSTLAANPDAERLLSQGELVGVWPEGFKGVGKPFSERYKLQRFGRGGFVSAALRTGAPIIPCSIVGAEEIYPIIGNMRTVARLVGAPYAPITPTWPLLGPLGLVPLPSKWIIEFGSPVETADLGPGAADDPMLVFDLTDQVRETIQQTLYSLLMQRRSVFF